MVTGLPQLDELGRQARETLAATTDDASLEQWRIDYLSRGRGRITAAVDALKTLPPAERPAYGKAVNALKRALEAEYEARKEALARRKLAETITRGKVDVTLPGRAKPVGRLHPTTRTLRDILAAFAELGFQVAEGPEVEWDTYNFTKLRIPPDHPARDMWDTFWVDVEQDGERPILLRTHTSPNQIRVMERMQPPVRIVVPGRCYRFEATDATHEWMLTQVEVLAVDEGITLADLKGTLDHFAKRMFGPERRIMLHHSYFPFVEPGVEVAVDCFICSGSGTVSGDRCPTCKGSGWIEILGAGMVHPEALAGVGYDATRYTGFAAGLGVERIAMLRYGINDIREFYKNDPRFLEQF
jgi:phenylalanyl-tRNA synthetase alpha chain